MTRPSPRPPDALLVTTYMDLSRYAQAFAQGHLHLLILQGAPGLEKSRTLRAALTGIVCWIDGNATPFGLYGALYRQRHHPVVIDDVDSLYHDRAGIRLLKALCQTEPVKTVSWLSDARSLVKEGIPRQFTTQSRVAVIANRWPTANPDVTAVADRGLVLAFEPSAGEVHRRTGEWYWDQEVFDFIGAHVHLLERLSMRLYVLAWQVKQAGLDWKGYVLGRALQGSALLVARLKADPELRTEGERVRAFVARGGGCRATYFNQARKLTSREPLPTVILQGQPPVYDEPGEDYLHRLRRRFGDLGNG